MLRRHEHCLSYGDPRHNVFLVWRSSAKSRGGKGHDQDVFVVFLFLSFLQWDDFNANHPFVPDSFILRIALTKVSRTRGL